LINLKVEPDVPLSFSTSRLTLRRYELDDDVMLFEAARESIDEVYPYLPWCHPDYSIDDSRSWLLDIKPNWDDKKSFTFAIVDRVTGKFLGGCGLNSIDENPIANLGYWVRTSDTGRGIAAEAATGLLHFGFEHLGLIRIEILMSTKNEASKKVALLAGGTFEGILRNRLLLHGENHDAYLYSVLPNDMIGN
jgi:RimJ/RimL family protein N-acetyltransferase|tara:strand:- start:47373 stop:47948 length:576 start_codon:yes stop_codon:yes gene_type:complete